MTIPLAMRKTTKVWLLALAALAHGRFFVAGAKMTSRDSISISISNHSLSLTLLTALHFALGVGGLLSSHAAFRILQEGRRREWRKRFQKSQAYVHR